MKSFEFKNCKLEIYGKNFIIYPKNNVVIGEIKIEPIGFLSTKEKIKEVIKSLSHYEDSSYNPETMINLIYQHSQKQDFEIAMKTLFENAHKIKINKK